ncbi:MAG: AtpZ/AtpI family protein [Bacteroidetes bacterium]|nr:AtpZ/AtpI family protein [Bacteroidota bacterium]
MKTPNKPPKDKGEQYRAIAKYSGLGFEMVAAIIVPTLIGQKVDQRVSLSDKPLFTILFGFLGVAYVMYRIFKLSSE